MLIPYKDLKSTHLNSLVIAIRIVTALSYVGIVLFFLDLFIALYSVTNSPSSDYLLLASVGGLLVSGFFAIFASLKEKY